MDGAEVSEETGKITPPGPDSGDGRVNKTQEFTLCPRCCTIEDVLSCEHSPGELPPLAKCAYCSFTFPILPGEPARLTLAAMREHDCGGPDGPDGWPASVGRAIVCYMRELGMSSEDFREGFESITREYLSK